MTMSETENRADGAPGLAPEHGRAGMVLCALVAVALMALVAQIAIDHGGRKIRIGEGGMAEEPAVPYGEPAPDFALPALDGTEVSLADYRGQVVLVDFWATWCGPCIEELPHIENFHRQYADSGLRVLALSTDMDDDAVQPFIDENDYTFTVLHADDAVQRAYGVTGIPVVYLVDRQGRVRWHRVGFRPGGEEDIGRELEKLLDEPVEAPTAAAGETPG